MTGIVVGVDGSESAQAALRFALAEARLRDVPVRVVGAWQVPVAAVGGGFVAPDAALVRELPPEMHGTLARALEEVGDLTSGVEVETTVREGGPATVLLEEAQDADLLVVGTRGLGSFRGLLLGSVSQQCAQHAPCPVVIVPPSREL